MTTTITTRDFLEIMARRVARLAINESRKYDRDAFSTFDLYTFTKQTVDNLCRDNFDGWNEEPKTADIPAGAARQCPAIRAHDSGSGYQRCSRERNHNGRHEPPVRKIKRECADCGDPLDGSARPTENATLIAAGKLLFCDDDCERNALAKLAE